MFTARGTDLTVGLAKLAHCWRFYRTIKSRAVGISPRLTIIQFLGAVNVSFTKQAHLSQQLQSKIYRRNRGHFPLYFRLIWVGLPFKVFGLMGSKDCRLGCLGSTRTFVQGLSN